ncbi:MAG: DUF5119 domain-containing protein [Bacteroides sp.]|nr:DUF5119 domain-containing protein [Bacteroides sp.]
MKTKVLTRILMCVLALSGLASCDHKELCYDHSHTVTIRLAFDWQNAPEATPEGMCAYFYSQEDGSVQRFDFSDILDGEIEISAGTYQLICYNNDTEGVLFSGTGSFGTHMGYTREGSIFESIYGSGVTSSRVDDSGERVVICPDMMWGCSSVEMEIAESGVSYYCVPVQDGAQERVESAEQVITLYPAELICTYTYEIRNVNNLKYATQMCGTLSSMAPSLLFATEELGSECVTIPFASVSDGVSRITGGFYTFGHNTANTDAHKFLLYVWITDGSKYYYTFDVTEQIENAEDRRHVHIIIDGVDFPQPITNGNGFTPAVDEWGNVDEDIIM